jgi:hypothetical protein
MSSCDLANASAAVANPDRIHTKPFLPRAEHALLTPRLSPIVEQPIRGKSADEEPASLGSAYTGHGEVPAASARRESHDHVPHDPVILGAYAAIALAAALIPVAQRDA